MALHLRAQLAAAVRRPHRKVGRAHYGVLGELPAVVQLPDGALCRCGMRGCIEAYAADYGILRAAYSVPDSTPPAASIFCSSSAIHSSLAKSRRSPASAPGRKLAEWLLYNQGVTVST